MNVHPLLVHFPIAFLTTYAVFELVRFKRVLEQVYWFYVKAILVCLGVVSATAAAIAGKLIQSQFSDKTLVSIHEHVNESAIVIFAILAFCYSVSWLQRVNSPLLQNYRAFWHISGKIEKIVLHTPLLFLFVIPGLLLITLGGALGGLIVYGPHLDFFTSGLYELLVTLGLLK